MNKVLDKLYEKYFNRTRVLEIVEIPDNYNPTAIYMNYWGRENMILLEFHDAFSLLEHLMPLHYNKASVMIIKGERKGILEDIIKKKNELL